MRGRALLVAIAVAAACVRSDSSSVADSAASGTHGVPDTPPPAGAAQDGFLISESGVGPIRLGMTLAQAQRALPSAVFKRTTDGDGAALVEVTVAPDQQLTLWADEEDADTSIDWANPVKRIEAFTAAFHTEKGVHPGSLVTEVERAYGKTRLIEESEIESRQYIAFSAQPAYLTLRLDYTGVFRAGEKTTTEFQPNAKIMSIAISSY